MSSKKIILVTGGTGLVGTAIKNISNKPNGTYKKNMKYVFASSKDCDLTNYEKTTLHFIDSNISNFCFITNSMG